MRKLISEVAALTLAAAGTVVVAAPAAQGHPSDDADRGRPVLVRGDGTQVTLSRTRVDEGRISFKVETSNTTPGAGSQITLFRLVGHATLTTFKADLVDEFSQDPKTAAKGTRELNRDIRAYGLADVSLGMPVIVTERLSAGKYFVMDLANTQAVPNPTFTTFTVRDSDREGSDSEEIGTRHRPVITLTSKDRFMSPRTLPARGTVTVRSTADTLHFMALEPVKKGTTDKQVQAYFDSGSHEPPPFAVESPSIGMDVLSPGRQLELTYKLPPGTYVLLCFVADDVTGIPHALMGMHKVVTLK